MICSVVYRFRAIPFSPQSRLEIAGFAHSAWYRFGGAVHSFDAEQMRIVQRGTDKEDLLAA